MLVKTIEAVFDGQRWEIYKHVDKYGEYYTIRYFERYGNEWEEIGAGFPEERWSKEAIEMELEEELD